jgi:hypothetical protein
MYGSASLLRIGVLTALLVAGNAVAAEKRVRKTVEISATTVTEVVSGTTGGVVDTVEGHGTISVAPTAEQAEEAYQTARKSFMAVASGGPDVKAGDVVQKPESAEDLVAGGKPQNIALENIRIVLDVDNITLREMMTKIVTQAAAYTGPWTVKWRLRPENMELLDERVNLTAEANFGEFCDLLTERVKNMSGIQLYVTAFASSRVLMIADTYY